MVGLALRFDRQIIIQIDPNGIQIAEQKQRFQLFRLFLLLICSLLASAFIRSRRNAEWRNFVNCCRIVLCWMVKKKRNDNPPPYDNPRVRLNWRR